MTDLSVDIETPTDPSAAAGRPGRAGRAHRQDWRLGGRTTTPWNARVLGVALLALGVGVLGGVLLDRLVPNPWGAIAGTGLLWVAMAGAAVWALVRSRPIGLLRFRAVDLVWGLGLGILTRIVQGWLAAAGGDAALPSYPTIGGGLPEGWWFDGLLVPIVIAPPIEEFFFRGVVLVSLFTLLRRPLGALAAAIIAGLASTGFFVFAHALTLTLNVTDTLSLTVLGLVTGAIVLFTGRIWPALLVHIVYNAAFVALAVVGTYLR